jgi:hypothetical protein
MPWYWYVSILAAKVIFILSAFYLFMFFLKKGLDCMAKREERDAS